MKSNDTKRSSGMRDRIIALLVVCVILVSANIILKNMRVRIDLTEENIYSLSDGTKKILEGIDEPVVLKYFFSSSIPVPAYLKNHADEVENLLKEYVSAGRGKIKLEKYDPEPDSDAEEWAQKYGLNGQPVEMWGPPVYLGLVAVSGGKEEIIPALGPEQQSILEYTITRVLHRVSNPSRPKIGVLSSMPVMGFAPQFAMPGQASPRQIPPWMIFQDLGQDYDLVELPYEIEKIGSDLDTLIIVHPKNLPPVTLYAIDQYLLGGGKLFVFLDPVCVADEAQGMAEMTPYGRTRVASDMPELLSAWGVEYAPDKVVADLKAATLIRDQENPNVLSLTGENMSKDDIVTAMLEDILMLNAGVFKDKTSDDLAFIPLITSSESAGMVSDMSVRFDREMGVRQRITLDNEKKALAVRLSGKFKTAFPEGKPKQEQPEGEEEQEKTSEGPGLKEGKGTVILVGDVDMMFDAFCLEQVGGMGGSTVFIPRNDNIHLFGNAVENLSGSESLMEIRSRGRSVRPFEKVLELEARARKQFKEQEKMLIEQLQQTRIRLDELEAQKEGDELLILTKEQQEEIKKYTEREIEVNRELKKVRKQLRADIERLGILVKTVNIALMPTLVAIAGICFGIYRKKKAKAGLGKSC